VTAVDARCAILGAGRNAVPGPKRLRLLAPPAMRPLVEAHPEGLRALLLAYGPAMIVRGTLPHERAAILRHLDTLLPCWAP
jgi:alpha-ketoglutarate-dependent taurine dioxygenase